MKVTRQELSPELRERFRAAEAILGRKHVTVWLDRETYEYLAAFKIGGESVGVRAAAQHFVKYGIARHQEGLCCKNFDWP